MRVVSRFNTKSIHYNESLPKFDVMQGLPGLAGIATSFQKLPFNALDVHWNL